MEKQKLPVEIYIEGILFFKNTPTSIESLSSILDVSKEEIESGLNILNENLSTRGLTLVRSNNECSITTNPLISDIIEKIVKEELNRELSTASLETLSIIAYKGLVSKKEIEYIRGVNSSFSLRNLLLRGLIEREQSKLDERIFLYKPSINLLLHLGIKSIDELPQYKEFQKEISLAKESSEITEENE